MNRISKQKIIAIIAITIIAIIIYQYFTKKEEYTITEANLNIINSNENNTKEKDEKEDEKQEQKTKIVIYITGEVNNKGVFEIEEDSRISDAIEIAGGLTNEANIENINLASKIEDGMKIYIPKKGEENSQSEVQETTKETITKSDTTQKAVTQGTQQTTQTQSKVNINTANQTELETLPGIGPSTALKIINYRKENGKFNKIEDIKNVSGIGESKYSKIKDYIKV